MSDTFGPCPQCGSSKVIRSRRKGFKERMMKVFSPKVRFYRCHKCGARFLLPASAKTGQEAKLLKPGKDE